MVEADKSGCIYSFEEKEEECADVEMSCYLLVVRCGNPACTGHPVCTLLTSNATVESTQVRDLSGDASESYSHS